MALWGYSEIVGGSCGASSDNPANVQCVTYFLLTEREGRTGRILPEVVQERLRAIFSQCGPELARVNKKFIIWLCLTLYYLKSEPWRIGMNETVYRKAYKTQQFYSTQEMYIAPWWGGGLPYISYIGMCAAQIGMVFEPFWSEIGHRFWPFWSEIG